jgi:hypothetical protein
LSQRGVFWQSNIVGHCGSPAKNKPLLTADVKAVQMSNKNGVPSYSLALILKSGAEILLEGGSTSDLDEIAQVATKIRAQLTPYLQ